MRNFAANGRKSRLSAGKYQTPARYDLSRRESQRYHLQNTDNDSTETFDAPETLMEKALTKITNASAKQYRGQPCAHSAQSKFNQAVALGLYRNVKTGEVVDVGRN